ncbi:MAG: S8 family serine peptidase, partial [Lachnospiraceae bacterium]|nr:S8 family serine peptidase [Lachnospiraceae bacterium]
MKKRIHQLLAWMLAAVMILSLVSPAAPVKAEPAEGAAQESTEPGEDGSVALEMTDLDPASLHVPKLGEISEEEEKFEEREASIALPPDQTVRVSIFLKKDATLDAGHEAKGVGTNSSAIAYRDSLRAQQRSLTSKIESRLGHTLDVQWNLTLLVNAISAYVKVREIPLIEGLDGVASVEIERQYEPMAGGKADEPNTSNTSQYMVGAAAAWADGYTGAGSRIAIIDTGLDTTHQSFNADAFNHAISLLEDAPTLMTSADVTRVSSQLNGSGKYFTSKIPYGYNYVDKNSTNITHTSDTQGEHGSHVAGIAAANRFIKSGSSYNDAASTVHAVGMAPDAQLLVMKVFGSSGGAYDSDYMSAIEDAVVLGCDSANLSLGGGSPGWTYGGSYQQVLNSLTSAKNPNMVVTISAGNSGALDDELETNLYIEDVSEHTGGSPGTYINSLGVASADNIGNTGAPLTFNGSQQVFYTDSNSTGVMTGVTGSYQYVYIDAAGSASDYQTVNSAASLSGKIVLVNRGSLSFADKAKNAASYSPKGLVIVNNDKGTISMSVEGFTGSFPVVSIRMADGEQIKAGGSRHTAGSVTYYTGTVVVSSQISTGLWTSRENAEISSFSSWGVPGSLLMKPEITAPGGDIYSVYGTNKTSSGSTAGGSTKYELMSGTSMAAPHMAGLSAVTAQYLREKNLAGINSTLTGSYSQRAIIQSLLMSTATPMKPEGYLPVLQQGSGLANGAAAVRASSVIMMDEAGLTTKTGQAADGKVKFEFGDDKDKEGVYRYSFTIYNISDHDLDYTLKTDLFTQKRSGEFMDHATTGLGAANVSYQWENIGGGPVESHDVDKDGDTDNDDAQAILDYLTGARAGSELNLGAGEMDGDGVLTTKDARELIDWQPEGGSSYGAQTVPAGGKRSVEVTIRLTNAQKQFLDETYPKGAYIEGFTYVTCTTVTAEGRSYEHEHSIPILGFYGSWTTPSMFDNTSYADVANGTNTKTPYSGKTDTNYMTVSYNGRTIKLTGNPYTGEETFPEDRLAINSAARIVRVAYNLYRGAGTTGFAVSKLDENHQVTDVLAATVSSTEVDGLWYYQSQGTWQGTSTKTASVNKTVSSYGLQEGDLFRAGFYAIPEYYGLLLADDATASSAGVLTSARFQTLLQQNLLGQGALIGYDFVVDNTAPMVTGAALNSDGTITVEASDERNLAYVAVMSLDGTVKYAEAVPGTNTYSFSFDASDAVANADGYVAVFAGDYAGNEDAKAVKVNNKGTEDPYSVESVNLSAASLDLYKGGIEDLTAEVLPMTAEDRTVTWTSSKASVASVDEEGHVTAVGAGSATITVTSNSDPSKSASCQVKVTSVDKQLNAVLWDENGGVYFSRFNASGLPAWTKLHNDAKTLELHAAFMNTSSALYAGTLDMSNQSTVLYQVNRSSYALTEYGTNYVLATDMARTNSSGYFVYTFANYLVYGNVAPESYDGAMYSGLPYGMLDVSETIGEDVYLAAVAARSIGSTSYYYLLDANG